ncbi:MAG: hypothetical protein ACYS1A_00275 [Planctomycetota bacterium]|jgi:hypothetical protein
MKQDVINNSSQANRALGQLAADKKKTVIALGLIAVMVFMWVRVLGGKTPEAAKATPRPQETSGKLSDSQLTISFVELPKVEGRNDILTRDFFAIDSWKDFTTKGSGEVNVVSGDSNEEVARKAVEKLKLEAIVFGENPQAFISDNLVAVGDKLSIGDGANKYEFEVSEITEKTVLISYGGVEIALKLTEGQ